MGSCTSQKPTPGCEIAPHMVANAPKFSYLVTNIGNDTLPNLQTERILPVKF